MDRLLVLQKKCIRLMYNIGYRDSCREAFKENKIFTVYSLYVYKCILFVLDLHVPKIDSIHSHNTRYHRDYYRQGFRKKNTDRDVKVKGTLFYNRLPPSIKELTGPKFVSKLKLFLLNKCLYSISEL